MITVEDARVARQVAFSELDVGDTFLYSGYLYMKISVVTVFSEISNVESAANCVSVNGALDHIEEHDMVEPVDLKISIVF